MGVSPGSPSAGVLTISPCQELKGDPNKGRGCQPMLQCLEGKAGQSPPGGLAQKTPSRSGGAFKQEVVKRVTQ